MGQNIDPTVPRPNLEETGKHRRAFQMYLEMGEQRSLKDLAKRIGRGESTMCEWSRAFGWQERIASINEMETAEMALRWERQKNDITSDSLREVKKTLNSDKVKQDAKAWIGIAHLKGVRIYSEKQAIDLPKDIVITVRYADSADSGQKPNGDAPQAP